MPNHVTNRVVVTGPSAAVATFRDTFIVEGVELDDKGTEHRFLHFDFNTIVPRPEVLRKTESRSAVRAGLLILGRSPNARNVLTSGSTSKGLMRVGSLRIARKSRAAFSTSKTFPRRRNSMPRFTAGAGRIRTTRRPCLHRVRT